MPLVACVEHSVPASAASFYAVSGHNISFVSSGSDGVSLIFNGGRIIHSSVIEMAV